MDGSEANIAGVKAFLEAGIKPDLCWRDAGGAHTWYPSTGGPYKGSDQWLNTGTWEVDRKRFPNGLRAISDHAGAKGVRTIVWFEPERVAADTWLTRNHPEWILGGERGGVLNLGLREARDWVTEHIDGIIVREGVDLYRQDYNVDPLGAWRPASGTACRWGAAAAR